MRRAAAADPASPDYAFYYASGLGRVNPAKWEEASLDVARRFPTHERGAQALYWLGARAKTEALVVGDLPFGLAHDSFPKLLGYCRRFLQEGGVKAVKIEGGASLAPSIARLIDAGIPVMGHVGMLPQRVHAAGYRRRGLTPEDQKKILIDAQAVAAAGAFAIVVECVDEAFMPKITEAVDVPTIGIGSGRGCDGQILVIHDLLGLTPEPPPFARPEANLHRDAVAAVRRWAAKVRTKKSK
jgi:3-methyl-2-oxobutanoate hydroxymethyltransferase